MPRNYLLIFTIIAVSAHWSEQLEAQSCACVNQEEKEAFEKSAAVFEGQVKEILPALADQSNSPAYQRVRLQVARSWKGVREEQLVISTAGGENCGYNFAVGRSYLVYAQSVGTDLVTSACSRTKLISEAESEIKAMGIGAITVNPRPTPEETSVFSAPPASRPPKPAGCASCQVGRQKKIPAGAALSIWIATAACARRIFRVRTSVGSKRESRVSR